MDDDRVYVDYGNRSTDFCVVVAVVYYKTVIFKYYDHFTLGTVICAAAPAFPILLIGRFIQAIGTGMILPIIFNVFLLIYPFKRGKIMGIVGFVIMFAPTIGPTLSGVIVEYLGWRSLFIMVIPFSIFSIAFASKFLINVSEVTKPKIDYLSLVFQL